ncbi:MAG: hypothetical protein AB7G15_00590 [Alphaproteobacteria bacterium]
MRPKPQTVNPDAGFDRDGLKMLCGRAGCGTTLIARLRAAPFPDPSDPRLPYHDNRVLIHVPAHFDAAKPLRVVVFFHGHVAEIENQLVGEYDLPGQIDASGRNVILIAPQMARNVADSNPGKLARPNGLAELIDEAVGIAARVGGIGRAERIAAAPVILASFSGGYRAAAFSLERGGISQRTAGLLMLDSLYGEHDRLAAWSAANYHKSFLVALFTDSSRAETESFKTMLDARAVPFARHLNEWSEAGISVLEVSTAHDRVPTDGPPARPLAAMLKGLPQFHDIDLPPIGEFLKP